MTLIALGKREIRALPVKCDNMERGCQWVGTVGTLEEHVGVCQFTLVPCPKECKDDNEILTIMMRDLQQHLMKKCPNRDYSCEHCGLKGTYAATLDHYGTCEKKIISCTNEECTMEMERMKIKNHLSEECEHTVISCKYISLGCDVKLKRKDMRAHEQDDKAHLTKTADTVIELKNNNKNILGEGESMIFKVSDFQKRKDSNDIFYSPSFYTSPNGYHMKIRVDANGHEKGKGTHVSVYIYLIKGEYDAVLKWPFVGDIAIVLLNQLEDKNHWKKRLDFTGSVVLGFLQYFPHSKLSCDSASNTQYLEQDTLYFRISIVKIASQKSWLQCTV